MTTPLLLLLSLGCRGFQSEDPAQSVDLAPAADTGADTAVEADGDAVDSDGDGLSDEEEEAYGTDPEDADSDDDGLTDAEEQELGTNPNDADSDGDGLSDGEEVEQGTNPTDATDGLPEDDDDLWDWGDASECEGCDPSVFEGEYDLSLRFSNASYASSSTVCVVDTTVTVDEEGRLDLTETCTSSTGLEFEFKFTLEADFTGDYASPSTACLVGSASVLLPSGTLYAQSFAPSSCQGLLASEDSDYNQYYGYQVYFGWQPTFYTPSGPVTYDIILY